MEIYICILAILAVVILIIRKLLDLWGNLMTIQEAIKTLETAYLFLPKEIYDTLNISEATKIVIDFLKYNEKIEDDLKWDL